MPQKLITDWTDLSSSGDINSGGINDWTDLPSGDEFKDQPSKIGSMLDIFRKYDKPLLDITPYTSKIAEMQQNVPKPMSEALLSFDPFGTGQIARAIEHYTHPDNYDPSRALGLQTRGAGELATSLTSPSNLALIAASGGAGLAAKAGMPLAAKGLTYGARAISAPIAAAGIRDVATELENEDPWTLGKFGRVGMGAFNTLLGGAGMFQGIPKERLPEPAPKVTPVPRGGPIGEIQPQLPGTEAPFGAPLTPSELARLEPEQMNLGLGEPEQLPLNFNELRQRNFFDQAMRPGPYGAENAPEPLPFVRPGSDQPLLPFDPSQSYEGVPRATPFETGRPVRMEDFVPPSPRPNVEPPLAGPPAEPLAPGGGGGGSTISGVRMDTPDTATLVSPNATSLEQLRQQGFRPSVGARSPEGYAQWTRTPENIPREPTAFERTMRAKEPIQQDEITFNADNELTLPKEKVTKEVINNLKENGIELVGTDEAGNPVFKQTMEEPQFMKVPKYKEGNAGLPNVAVGGADPRVLDVLGSSLYANERPLTVLKELIQNAGDEHDIAGVTEPMRVHIDHAAPNPVKGGPEGKSITVRDRGRGLQPEQIYTVLTDLGKTGKAGVKSAAGGFGFAKAAPFLGGEHVEVMSVVDTPGGRLRYTFKGNPAELKNQARGVPLDVETVGDTVPTGLQVKTFYPSDVGGFYKTERFARRMIEGSPSIKSGAKVAENYSPSNPRHIQRWLDETPENPIREGEYNHLKSNENTYGAGPLPTLVDTIKTPGADVNIHYDIPPGTEAHRADIHLMNKGMYQGTNEISYGDVARNVPKSIVADINATVEEGHANYPFSANREQVNRAVESAIGKWVNENIVTGVTRRRIAELQKQYDGIKLLNEDAPHDVHFYDEGNKFTPEELKMISEHPAFNKALGAMERVHQRILAVADKLGWNPINPAATWKIPSERLRKFGLLFEGPKPDGTTMGVHIPRPDDPNSSALLINLFEHLNNAAKADKPIDHLVSELFTTIAHEQAHIPGGPHDNGFAYRDADLRGRIGEMDTVDLFKQLRKAFDDGTGKLSPEISDLLQVYNESRGRGTSSADALLATGISSKRSPGAQGPEVTGITGTRRGKTQPSVMRELYNLPRGITTTMDLSAPMRQGLPLIATKQWWTSWKQQLASLGSEGAYQKTLSDLRARPMFQSKIDLNTGKVTKSFAEQAGIKLMDVASDLTRREEAVASNWAETGGMFGKSNPVQAAYKGSLGRIARASNRAYTAYLNQLRADTFESLIKDAMTDFQAGVKGARNPYTDMPFAKEIADYVNTATGRGPLRIARPSLEGGKFGLKESSFEQNAKLLTDTIFSPRLMASRVRMLNPATYMMASPFVRKQYLKSLLSVAGAWGTISSLAQGAGADVSTDMNSADFGKIRIGNTRLDPAAGFQQYLVAAHRLISGKTTSSASDRMTELGTGYQAPTRKDVVEQFVTNKMHPVVKFGYDLLHASQYRPFSVGDRTAQLFVPLIVGDVLDLAKDDPNLLPLIGPTAIGMGTQTYDKGQTLNKFIDPENDWVFKGGGSLLPPYDQ